MSTFPNIPNVPGVPPLPRSPSFQNAIPQLLGSDTLDSFGPVSNPVWGLFKGGQSVVTADSVQTVEYRQDWAISDYPLEKGAFESYNKVSSPYGAKIRFASGSAEEEREALLDTITKAASGLDLFDLVTPEKTYSNVNIEHYDYARSSRHGVGMIMVDVWVVEIRENAKTTFSKTQSPASEDTTSTGTVQTTQPTQPQLDKTNQVH